MSYNILSLELKGHVCRYIHIPKSDKPTLIVLPGALQDIETTGVFHKALSLDYNYFFVELPGTGGTSILDAHHPFGFIADCLYDLTEKLALNKFHLVTCSYATAVGLEFAKKYSYKIDRMVMIGSMKTLPQHTWAKTLDVINNCANQPEKFAPSFLTLITSENSQIPRQNVIRHAILRKASKFSSEQLWSFIHNSIRLMSYSAEGLQRIICPVLCFTGEFDPYVTPEDCKALSESLPNAEFKLIPLVDHLAYLQRPDVTMNIAIKFLQ